MTTIAALALAALTAGAAHAQSDWRRTTAPFSVSSNGTGELSSAVYAIAFTGGGPVEASYRAPATHCSAMRMHFLLDGAERAVSGLLPPGRDSGFVYLGEVRQGEHKVQLRAEGVRGGCNSGRLVSWGGVASLRLPGEAPADASGDLGAVFFLASSVNYARGYVDKGCYLTEQGEAHSFAYGRGDEHWTPTQTPDHLFEGFDLVERFGHGRALTGRVKAEDVAGLGELRSLAIQAEKGPVQVRHVAYDAGFQRISAFVRQAPRAAYKEVVLSGRGDFNETNASSAARALLERLARLGPEAGCPLT